MTHLGHMQLDMNDGVVDTYHGIDVADPFRWLENHQSSRTREWIDRQSNLSRAYLQEIQGRDTLKQRITELLDRETIVELRVAGDTIFYTKRLVGNEQPSLYRRKGLNGQEALLLDPASLGEGHALSLTILDVSPDGGLLAFGLRTGGQGARRVHVLDVKTLNTLPDVLPKSAIRGFAFLPQNKGFLYSIEEVGKPTEPKTVKRHFFGLPYERDKTIFYAGRASNMRLVSGFDLKSLVAVHTVIRSVKGANLTSVHLQMLGQCGSPLLTLVENTPDAWDVRIHNDDLYVLFPQQDGSVRSLIRVDLTAPDLARANTVLVEGEQQIEQWHIFGNRLLTKHVEDLSSVLRIYEIEEGTSVIVELPEPGTAHILDGNESGFFFTFESYSRQSEVRYFDFSTGRSIVFGRTYEGLPGILSRRLEYLSHENTLVPLTLVGHEEALKGGNAPILLTAYGAAGLSMTPQFSVLASCFVELGGIFCIAHVRGGGEYGQRWEEAGKRHRRPTVHKDFLAARDFLVASGVANEGRIAIAGGSNSGLLVCTAMTQQPGAFRCVLCIAPLTDMLRYHHFDNTQFYIPQFGSADDLQDFEILLSYSPYHNVHTGTTYPALLMVSGDADTRCDPMHARKFVARLQAAIQALPVDPVQTQPILLDWNPLRGHFATLPLATRIGALVDRVAFLCDQLHIAVS